MDVSAKITGIRYQPLLCRPLNRWAISDLESALSKDTVFILVIDKNRELALSWWVSPKRTRSYPYAKVYNSLSFSGKKVTVIPVIKDEGKDGDRDFLQWDTVSLMSLLSVYTIISYYGTAERSSRYTHKIRNQRFDIQHIKGEIDNILCYQSDALHWNLAQLEKIKEIAQKALASYGDISKRLGVDMHSLESAEKRIERLIKSKDAFLQVSRELARKAQSREVVTVQPKEKLAGVKASITIRNYLGGCYFFTCDEVKIEDDNIYLIEGKHSKKALIPSLDDIKDGLIKMILFTNLREVEIGDKEYNPIAVLRLTSDMEFVKENLRTSQLETLQLLKKEAKINNFMVMLNGINLQDIEL
jgi:hypothetical protein